MAGFTVNRGRGLTEQEGALRAGGAVNTGTFLQSIGGGNPLGGNTQQLPTTSLQMEGMSTAGIYTNTTGLQKQQISSFIQDSTTDPNVSSFSMAVGQHVWAINTGSYVLGNSSAAAIGYELDFGNLNTTTTTINGTQAYTPGMTLAVASTTGAYAAGATGPGILNYGGAALTYTGTSGGNSFTGVTQVAGGAVSSFTNATTLNYSTGGNSFGLDIVYGTLVGAPGNNYIQMGGANTYSYVTDGVVFQQSPIARNALYFNNISPTTGIAFASGTYTQAIFLSSLTAQYGMLVNGGTYSSDVLHLTPTSVTGNTIYMSGSNTTAIRMDGTSSGTFLQFAAGTAAGIWQTPTGLESTGAGSAALGANCPAVTVTAPYKWLKAKTQDGSTVFFPVWK